MDVLTDKVAVVIQDRPVVAMTAWLSDAFRAVANAGLGLQIVTPAGTRLSPAVRGSLPGWPSRWVVQDERDGYYDGLTGAVLRWSNGLFVTADSPEATPRIRVRPSPRPSSRAPVTRVSASWRSPSARSTRPTTGSFSAVPWKPSGRRSPVSLRLYWGTEEPANLPWSLRQLTDVAHERAPEPTWLVVVGTPERPGLATVRVTRTQAGVEEDVTMVFGYGPGEQVPTDAVVAAAEALATRHDLQSMLVQIRRARRDLSVPPRFEGPGVPYAFVLGAEEVREMPGDRARRTPLPWPRGSWARKRVLLCTTRFRATRPTCRAGRTSSA